MDLPSPFRRAVPLVLALSLLVGCSGEEVDTADVRITEIRDARAAVSEPAGELAQAAAEVFEAVEALRVDPPMQPSERLDHAVEVRRSRLPALDAALAAAADAEVTGDTDDIVAARSAWEQLRAEARDLRAAALEELGIIDAAANIELELIEITEGWDEPGSRSQQITRFGELEQRAEALAARIDDAEVGDCLTTFERRRDAAATVAERTDELRGLIERYQGNEFDELRSEYRQDPFGLEAPLVALDREEADCWREVSPLVAAWDRFQARLRELEEALNPPDL